MSEPAPTPRILAEKALQRETAGPALAALRPPGGVPLLVRPTLHGNAELVHAVTGQVLGLCSTEEVAQRTRDFLS